MTAARVGDLGEKRLELWAAELGASCNPAYQDRKGWDYLIEFPQKGIPPSHSLDSRPPELSCLVQVKSTFSDRMRRSLKLSNLERAVKSPFPFFYLCLHFDRSNNSLVKGYLVHVDEQLMAKVLLRLRNETTKGNIDLAKLRMELAWKEDHILPTPDPVSFANAITSHVSGTISDYVQMKSTLLSSLGEPLAAEMKFTMSASDKEKLNEDWIDLAIGVRDSIEVDLFEIREDVRFDIPLATTKHEGGVLRVLNRSKEGTDISLSIRNNSLPLKSRFIGKLFTPHNFFAGTPIPEKQFKARVTFVIGEIVIRTYKRELNLRVDFSSAPNVAPLDKYSEIWRLAHILHNSTASGITVSITPPGQTEIDFVLPPTPPYELDVRYLVVSEAVEHACYIATKLGVPLSTSVPLDQILNQSNLFRHVRAIMDPEIPIAMIGGTISEIPKEDPDTLAVALIKRVQFGSLSILIQIGLIGAARFSTDADERSIFMVDHPETVIIEHQNEGEKGSDTEKLLSNIVDKLEIKYQSVIKLLDPIDKGFGDE
jgi:hypothetical protein